MLVSTKAIVLSKIRYKDSDLIVKCYTQHFGVKSYLLKNILKSKKGKLKMAYFQPLTLLDIEATHITNRTLHYIKEVKLYNHYISIHTNILKSSISLFIAEVLSNLLKEEEEDLQLYNFIESALIWFDINETDTNFHLLFLLEFTKYLGCYPNAVKPDALFFNLDNGSFGNHREGTYCISEENLTYFKQLLGMKFDASKRFEIRSAAKRELLNAILLYYKLHIEGFNEPKSVAVLNQTFN